jgi:hypothetical protein
MGISTLVFGSSLKQWGFYVDMKSGINTPEDERGFSLTLTPQDAESFGDFHSTDRSAWRSFNVAAVRVIGPALVLYAGAGHSRQKAYSRYFDPEQERGYLGNYWVRNDVQSGNRLNLLIGTWFRVTPHIIFQFGGELAPGGFTTGVAYALPFRR